MRDPNDPDGPERPDSEFVEASRLADQALAHARRHRSPPQPRSFEVWYTYAAGSDAALRARVDSELIKGETVDLDTIDRIYEEHFLQRRLSLGISRIGEELDGGLQETIGLIQGGLGSNRAYLTSLRQAQDRIARAPLGKIARKALSGLVEASEDHARETEAVGAELTRARAQVADLQRELNKLRDHAYLDHLTQIPNRRQMEEVLAREIVAARASGKPLAFALADLDNFKKLNDSYGHGVGDAVLKHFAALLRDNIKGQDTPARFGGEEFAIIFPKTTIFGASRVADSVRKLLHDTDFVLSRDRSSLGHVTVSFGVTQLLSGDNMASLIRRADELLYKAKRQGRNRVESDM